MKDSTIINIGKYTFLFFLILGNICLFGYLIFKIEAFAVYGFVLLLFAVPINLVVIAFLLIYGFFNKSQFNICTRASTIICINIPITILYYFIGISLLNF